MEISLTALPKPTSKKRISTLEILQGKNILPMDRLTIMSEDEFEEITLHWAHEYLGPKYTKVRSYAGAGDKGRDIVCYKPMGGIDIYQCKHYGSRISPAVIWVELGKLCYYTFHNGYMVPDQYTIVSSKGAGTSLLDLLDHPEKINGQLIAKWNDACKTKITKKHKVLLEGDFKKHVEDFDFSIVKELAPHEFIDQFHQTRQYPMYFGGGLTNFRDIIPKADDKIQNRELRYIEQLYKIYEQKAGSPISSKEDIKKLDVFLQEHFNNQRNSFYSTESLERFCRDNFADFDPLPFDELKEEGYSVIADTLYINQGKSGLDRLFHAALEIKRQSFTSNPLSSEMKVQDKEGICHYLANEDKVKWTE